MGNLRGSTLLSIDGSTLSSLLRCFSFPQNKKSQSCKLQKLVLVGEDNKTCCHLISCKNVVILNILLGPVSKFTVTALVDGAPYQCTGTVSIQLSRDALLCGGGGEAGGLGRGVANTTEGIGWEAQEPNILRDWGTYPIGERQAKVPSRCRHARAGKGEKDGEGRRTEKAEKPETKCT
jgi:hypothetical protein